MVLYEMTSERSLVSIPVSTFAREGIEERADLQRALREHIDVLGDDLLVVAEEFGDFDVKRRIDLLAVDRSARLVVIELKRTEDGGHMELQALRYAAMVSAMTFKQLVGCYARHLRAQGQDDADAGDVLAEWLADEGGEEAVIQRQVRIILASAGFDTQITTTVLWLNDVYGLDITCVRIVPYSVAGRLLLDVQPVVPLPEAAELTVRLRERESAARASAAATGGRDYTKYVLTTTTETLGPLNKRRTVLAMTRAVLAAGADPEAVAAAMPSSKLLPVDGVKEGDDLQASFISRYPSAEKNVRRWFFEAPFAHDGRTWVLSKMWGTNAVDTLDALQQLVPDAGISYEAAT